jgi:hypothetical protein
MGATEVYIDRVMRSQGLARQTALALLRWYLKTAAPDTLKGDVQAIQDVEKLKILWEAGLSSEQQTIVLKRYDELTGGKKGTWALK